MRDGASGTFEPASCARKTYTRSILKMRAAPLKVGPGKSTPRTGLGSADRPREPHRTLRDLMIAPTLTSGRASAPLVSPRASLLPSLGATPSCDYTSNDARAMTLGLLRTRCGFDRCFHPYGLLPLSCPQLSVSSSLFLLNTHLAWIRLLRSLFVPFSPWKSTLRRTYAHLQRSRKGCRLTCPQPGGREMGGLGPSRLLYHRVQ